MTQQQPDDLYLRDGRVLAFVGTYARNTMVMECWHGPGGLTVFWSAAIAELQVRYPNRRPSWQDVGMVCERMLAPDVTITVADSGPYGIVVHQQTPGTPVAQLLPSLLQGVPPPAADTAPSSPQ